jgi:hypothetical protein
MKRPRSLPPREDGVGAAMDSLVLHVAEDGDNFKLIWSGYKSGDPDPWTPRPYLVDAGLLQQAANAVRAQLRGIAFMPSCCKAAEFAPLLQKLAQRGRDLFLQLMPDSSSGESSEVQRRLEQLAQNSSDGRPYHRARPDLKVTLDTERLFVPWGFAFSGSTDHLPGMPSVSLTDMKGFWLSLFNISIAYGGSCSLPHHRKASFRRLFALHEDMFVRAKTSLEKRCLDRLNTLLEEDPTPATDWDSFELDWDVVKDDYDSVLYVYGHSDGQRIQLSDVANDPKYELLASSLKKFRKRARGSASIFMLNGCRTAAPSPASAEEPISANFLKETRQPGYYGFIGTEAQVSNIFACRYGTEFLWRLCKEGKSVGEAFDELLECDDLFPHNILYTCYADRKFRFITSVSSAEN